MLIWEEGTEAHLNTPLMRHNSIRLSFQARVSGSAGNGIYSESKKLSVDVTTLSLTRKPEKIFSLKAYIIIE